MEEVYPELDQLQHTYRAAVDEWVAAIRPEETLASINHSVAQFDQWEKAAFHRAAFRDSRITNASGLPARPRYSAVVGSIMTRTWATLLAGKPPIDACLRTIASSGAM